MQDVIVLLNWVFQDLPHFLGTCVLFAVIGASLGMIFHGVKD
jgi:hypothetical protein